MLLRLALYGGALFVGIPLAFAHVMTRSYRGSSASRPALGYEATTLVSDELKLRAWVAKGDPVKPAAGHVILASTRGLGSVSVWETAILAYASGC